MSCADLQALPKCSDRQFVTQSVRQIFVENSKENGIFLVQVKACRSLSAKLSEPAIIMPEGSMTYRASRDAEQL